MSEEKKSLEAITELTELEEKLYNLAKEDYKSQGINNPRDELLKDKMKRYFSHVEKSDQKYGFDGTEMHSDVVWFEVQQLIDKGLLTDQEFHTEIVSERRIYRGPVNSKRSTYLESEQLTPQTSSRYTITPSGKEKLREHRVAKNAHS